MHYRVVLSSTFFANSINNRDFNGVSYYEFIVKSFTKQYYKDGRGPTTLVGYDGMFPGPTIRQKRGVNSVLRVINDWTSPTVTHLHGSYSVCLYHYILIKEYELNG